jgi:hypothetical protein
MFCPKCKAEYREGFYVCSDCGLPLVAELPKEGAAKGKEFNKAELNLLKHLKSYRYLSITCMIAFTIGIMVAIYLQLFPQYTYESEHMNLVRLNGMIIMLALSFFLFICIRTIEKLRSNNKNGKNQS